MAEIVSSVKRDDDKINFVLALSYREAIALKGQMESVRVFSESNFKFDSKVEKCLTKKDKPCCFSVPKDMAKDLKTKSYVSCQKIDVKNKKFFIFMVED